MITTVIVGATQKQARHWFMENCARRRLKDRETEFVNPRDRGDIFRGRWALHVIFLSNWQDGCPERDYRDLLEVFQSQIAKYPNTFTFETVKW